jgi:hypothetical protein
MTPVSNRQFNLREQVAEAQRWSDQGEHGTALAIMKRARRNAKDQNIYGGQVAAAIDEIIKREDRFHRIGKVAQHAADVGDKSKDRNCLLAEAGWCVGRAWVAYCAGRNVTTSTVAGVSAIW